VGDFLGVDVGCFPLKTLFREFFILFFFPLFQFGFDGVFGGKHPTVWNLVFQRKGSYVEKTLPLPKPPKTPPHL